MNIKLIPSTFYATDKQRVTFITLELNGETIGKIMMTTDNEQCSPLQHEAIVQGLSLS